MPAPTPTGFLSKAITSLRAGVAASSSFRSWVSAVDENAALSSIFMNLSPRNPVPPFALVDFGRLKLNRYSLASNRVFQVENSSTMKLYMRAESTGDANQDNELINFCNIVAAVCDDLQKWVGNYAIGNIGITEMLFLLAPSRVALERRDLVGDYFETDIELTMTRAQ